MMYDTAHMSACIVLLCNGRHNGWHWAICITLCNHRNVFIEFEAVWLVTATCISFLKHARHDMNVM